MTGKSCDEKAQDQASNERTTRSPFQQAIPQSPAFLPILSTQQEEATYQGVLTYASQLTSTNITTLTQLRSLNFSTLYKINALAVAKAPYSTCTFGPSVDGVFVPDLPGKLLLEGKYDQNISLLAGHNTNESSTFTPNYLTTTEGFDSYVVSNMPESSGEVIGYIENTLYPPVFNGTYPYTNEFERLQLLLAEWGFYLQHSLHGARVPGERLVLRVLCPARSACSRCTIYLLRSGKCKFNHSQQRDGWDDG